MRVLLAVYILFCLFLFEILANRLADSRAEFQRALKRFDYAQDELARVLQDYAITMQDAAREMEHIRLVWVLPVGEVIPDAHAVVPVHLDACWRCYERISKDDDFGLCDRCKEELRDL